jgi:retinol dehydrogenase-12
MKVKVPVVDLTNKTAVVTGANGGIGLEIARSLLKMNARVIVASKSSPKTEAAMKNLKSGIIQPENVIHIPLDLQYFQSVKNFSVKFKVTSPPQFAITSF